MLFSAISFASASDISDNLTENQNTIEEANVQQDILGEGQKTFKELDSLVHNESIPEYGTVELNDDYTFSDSDIPSVGTNGISIDKSITIDGKGHSLNASNKAAIFKINNNTRVILKNIVFTNGNAINGGAVNVGTGSSFEIINCTFSNNFAFNNGGAIFIADDNVASNSIMSSIFKNNVASNGGAIYDKASALTITLCDFSYNSASGNGGSLSSEGTLHISQTVFDHESAKAGGSLYLNAGAESHSTIDFSTFKNCSSTGDGGAIFISSDNVALQNINLFDNVAGDDGGAIYWQGSNGLMYNITSINNRGISHNTSSTRGGAICLTGDDVTVSKSSFSSCYAYIDEGKDSSKVDGGAVFATGNGVIISDVTFNDCNSTNSGGALHVIGNHTQIINCVFDNCHSKDGGALFVNGTDCKLYDSKFTNNVAGDDGGAIFWEGDEGLMYNITCTNNKGISFNTSSTRGGTICLTGDNVTVRKSTFTSSEAYIDSGKDSSKVDGGALFITGNNINIIDTVFNDCNAVNKGGALYILGNNSNVVKCNFTYTQSYIGGAIFIAGNDAVVDYALFRHNTAADSASTGGSGGAIYVDGNGALITNSDFAYDSVINYGGAISVWGANANIINNVFDNCTTTLYYGGAIFVNGENATISLSNFTRSKAENKFAQGGAIQVSGNKANVFECNFEDCFAYYGGVIYISGSDAVVNTSTFKHSGTFKPTSTTKVQSPQWGGAIFVNGESAVIYLSDFTDFTAEEYGGAIFVAGINANISECDFCDCKVNDYHGGAIYIAGANTYIGSSSFSSCDALNNNNDGSGGAICIQGANTFIEASHFEDCEAKNGGDIYVFGNGARIEESTFTNSNADYGGAIYLTAWGAIIKLSNITSCEAGYSGGAIYVAGGGTTIIESDFEKCRASGTTSTYGGGAIYMAGSYNNIIATTFNDNRVASDRARGGTIYISSGEGTNIERSYFNDSYSGNGGIIFIEGDKVIISTSIFANSSSKDYGGAISIQGNNATVQDSIFENFAGNRGGAIFVDGESSNILRSSFNNCVAKYDGGAININDVGTTVAYSNFTWSKASNTGGAIYIQGENTTVTYCNLNNNTANVAGAIYINGQKTLISRSNLSYNNASLAGAIKVSGSDTVVTDCNLEYNRALTGNGGAMDLSGKNASVYYSNFYFNDAKDCGGAINWEGGHGDDSIIGSTFTNNTSHGTGMGGGAIYWTAGKGAVIGSGGLIKDSIFINNTAYGHHGGAIDWFHAIDSKIDNCLFINNRANSDGGALYTGDKNGNSLNFTIINSQFYNNTAGKHGGAIANQMTSCYIYNNTFDGNKAISSGGTILMKEAGGKNSVIDHCYIYNSFCDVAERWGESGGAIHIGASDTNVTISNCAIINSTVKRSYGGAVSLKSDYSSLINVTIQNVQASDGYGGAVYWSGSYGTFNNVTIFNATANGISTSRAADGGAICLHGSYCNLNDITITSSATNMSNSGNGNSAYGGAIYVSGTDNTLTNVNIDDSQALTVRMNAHGGAIFWKGNRGTLINATISNTLAQGPGGAIYWSGGSPTVENISIEYSRTNVTGSANDANGGAIYSTGISNLKNVHIVDAIASKDKGDIKGGAIYYTGTTLNNITVIGSRASTGEGTSYGGSVYWQSGGNGNLYNSSFKENTADYGGALFSDRTTNIYNTLFTGNVALDGGALYGQTGDDIISASTFELNSAKRGGAIFAQKVNFKIDGSTLKNNTAEEKGGAIYRNHNGASYIRNSDLINNTAFQGSAIYTVKFFELTNVVLLDNQANSKEFIEKAVGVDEQGNNYTSAIFVGYDNLLNAIWDEETTATIKCNNVTYWGVNGITVSNSIPQISNREVGQNVTVEVFNGDGVKINETDVVTDASGRLKYIFHAEDGETYYFAYTHKTDRYYTYLRETMSNSSLIKVYAYNPLYYGQNQTFLISLTDGAWGEISGNITLKIEGPYSATFEIEVINGTKLIENISGFPLGDYNVTVSFAGDINHTGDTDWVEFSVLPYADLEITKAVNITADYVNVSDVIEYTINVTNHGPSGATGVYVLENLSSYLRLIKNKASKGRYNLTNGIWSIGNLGAGKTATLTIIAEVIHMGPITNNVWVYGDGADINLTNNNASAHNFTAVPLTDLHIIKEVDVKKNVIDVLDEIKFTITVINYGPSNATGVYVDETLDDHLELLSYHTSDGSIYKGGTWQIGTLEKGKNVTLTIVARVIYSGNITNQVTVYGFENETNYTNNHDSIDNITAIANVDVGIIKTVNVTGQVNVTDFIEFNISVYNNGPCNASGVYVGEVLDSHLEMMYYNTTAENSTYDGYTWVIGHVNAGETVNLTIVARVISNGTISNAVVVTSVDNDTNTSNNNDTIDNITSLNIVDLDITKEVTKGRKVVNISDIIEFTITVINHGPCNATGVNVSEVLSPLVEMIYNYTQNGYYDVREGIWHIGDMANGSTAVLTIGCQVISSGIISNFVNVTNNENDTNTSSNNDTIEDIIVLSSVDLGIAKRSNSTSGFVKVTDFIEYTITVHNYGLGTATQANVTEVLGPYLKLVKSETRYGYYDINNGIWFIGNVTNGSSVELTLLCEVIGNGTIDNVVVVDCHENDTNPDNNRDELIIISRPAVDMRITKKVNVTGEIDVMDVIQFTVTVFNDGPCNASGVYVFEALSPSLQMINYTTTDGSVYDGYTWVIGDVANGTGVTLTITAQVVYSGVIENAVVVYSNEIDTNESNNKDNITNITAYAHVDVGIIKTVNVTTGIVNVSDLIEFTITVYNNGPCNASGVIVTEALDYHLEMVSYNTTNNSTYDGYSWIVGNVDVGNPVNMTLIVRVISEGIFGNFVSVITYDNDTNTSNDNDTIDNITALPVVDLEIIKEVTFGGSVVNVSDIVQFSITVINKGYCDATNVTVSEVLDPHLQMTYNSTWIGYYDVNEGIWHIGTLEKRTNVTLIIEARVISKGTISNFVSVTSYENDTDPDNNNDTIDNITALPVVDLEITKKSNITSGIVNVTEYIEYTITVHNYGPCNATEVNVTENLSPYLRLVKSETRYGHYDVNNGIWHIGNLANGSSVDLTLVCEVMGNGTIDNVVVVESYENDTNPINNRDELIIISRSIVDMRITKEVNVTATEIDVMDVIQFTVTVFNDGPCNASGVYVFEALSQSLNMINYTTTDGSTYDGYTWIIGDMANGTNVTLTITAQVVYSGVIENIVIVYSNEIDTNESNNKDNITNITAYAHVDVGVAKTVNVTTGVVNVNDLIEFNITVYNNGPCNASGVVVTEALDYHIEMVSYNTTNNSTYDGYSWIVGNVDVGETVNLTIVAKVVNDGIFGNFVSVITYDNDTNTSNDNDTIDNITALPVVDLYVNKTVDVNASVVLLYDVIEFTITVGNLGPCDATGVNVTEVLSPHLRLVSYSTWMGNYSVEDGMWYIGDLPRKTWVSLIISAQVISGGIIENVVNVTSNENDTNPDNNNDSIDNITAIEAVDLEVNKTVDVNGSIVYLGDIIEFTITVRNNGPCNATGVNVSEVLSPHLKMISNTTWMGYYDVNDGIWYIGDLPSQYWVALYIKAQVISEGIIENVVNVTSNENDTNPDNNNDSIDNITAIDAVNLVINKTVDVKGSIVYVGDVIEFTITVRNNGPCNATGVNVSEVLSPHLKMIGSTASRGYYSVDDGMWYIGDLTSKSGASLRIRAQVISEGIIENVVNVTSNENDTNPDDNNDSIDNITAIIVADVSVVKNVSVTQAHIGDIITYTITVHNYGPNDATNVNVTEKLSTYVKLIEAIPSTGRYSPTDAIWYIGKLSNGSTQTLTLKVELISVGIVENVVSVSATENDTNITNNNYTCDNVTVERRDTPIDLDTYDIIYGEDEILVVRLPSDVSGTVNITVGDRTFDEVPIDNGVVKLPVTGLGGGDYTVNVTYGGDDRYLPNSTSGKFKVKPVVPIIKIEVEDIWVGEVEVLNVTVNAPGTANITVYGITIEVPLNGSVTTTYILRASSTEYDGRATWNIVNLPAGRYPAFAIYNGNENYTSVNTSDIFLVKKLPSTVTVSAKDIHVGEKAVINVKVGPSGATGKVTITIEGRKYTKTVVDGKAQFVISGLKAGTKEVSVKYSGDDKYRSSKNSTTFKVRKYHPPIDSTTHDIKYGKDEIIVVHLPDDATGKVTITVDGNRYTAKVEDGKATFKIPGLKPGRYDVKVHYSGNGKYYSAKTDNTFKVTKKAHPKNNDTNNTNNTHKIHRGIDLAEHPTGNPIIYIILALMAIFSVPIRRFKK